MSTFLGMAEHYPSTLAGRLPVLHAALRDIDVSRSGGTFFKAPLPKRPAGVQTKPRGRASMETPHDANSPVRVSLSLASPRPVQPNTSASLSPGGAEQGAHTRRSGRGSPGLQRVVRFATPRKSPHTSAPEMGTPQSATDADAKSSAKVVARVMDLDFREGASLVLARLETVSARSLISLMSHLCLGLNFTC